MFLMVVCVLLEGAVPLSVQQQLHCVHRLAVPLTAPTPRFESASTSALSDRPSGAADWGEAEAEPAVSCCSHQF